MDLIKDTMKLKSKDIWHMSEKEIVARLNALRLKIIGSNRETAIKAKDHFVRILGRIGIAVFFNTKKEEYVVTYTSKFWYLQGQLKQEAV